MKRPTNHVTRDIDSFRAGHDRTADLPLLERAALERLEVVYQPRCLGRSETVEEHLRYAGMVELVDRLRARYDQHVASKSPDDSEDLLPDAERAS